MCVNVLFCDGCPGAEDGEEEGLVGDMLVTDDPMVGGLADQKPKEVEN